MGYEEAMPGTLFVVSTPIGNLQDITLRALTTLESVALIACEDTRVTRRLLTAHGITTPTTSYHAHSAPHVQDDLLRRLDEGDSIALVSDAGTPLISDPGATLIRAAIDREVRIEPIPGPSALLSAVVGAGLPPQPLLFLGFVPRTDRARREILGPLRTAPYTLVLYEAPNRVVDVLRALHRMVGPRPACVAREMTKRFETFQRGDLSALAAFFEDAPPQGEVVIVVGPGTADEGERSVDDIKAAAVRWLADGQSPADVARALAGAYGLPKREAYKLVVSLRDD